MLTDWFFYKEHMVWLSIGVILFGILLSTLLFGIARYQERYMQGKINGSAGPKGNRIRLQERCHAGAILVVFVITLPGFVMLLISIS